MGEGFNRKRNIIIEDVPRTYFVVLRMSQTMLKTNFTGGLPKILSVSLEKCFVDTASARYWRVNSGDTSEPTGSTSAMRCFPSVLAMFLG